MLILSRKSNRLACGTKCQAMRHVFMTDKFSESLSKKMSCLDVEWREIVVVSLLWKPKRGKTCWSQACHQSGEKDNLGG